MAKKHKNWKPQARKNTKPTSGKLEFVDVIYIEKERQSDGTENIYAICTCNEWRSSPEADTFLKIGKEAKAHVQETGHQLRSHEE